MGGTDAPFVYFLPENEPVPYPYEKAAGARRAARPVFCSTGAPGSKMGPILLQLPPHLGFNDQVASSFFSTLGHLYPQHQFVLEARHATWMQPGATRLLERWGIGWVIAQSGTDWPYAEMVTASNVYLRLHGPGQLYASAYTDAQLEQLALKIADWQRQGCRVWAYFNNDIHGYAPADALRLATLCGVALP